MSEKPEWAHAFLFAEELNRRAERERKAALAWRCQEMSSGGARCTADAKPEHQHRYRPEELPYWIALGRGAGEGFDFEPAEEQNDDPT